MNGLNVQLHVAHINRYGPETVLILNHRMGNLHVQGLGMKQRTVNQLDHALLMENGLNGVHGNNVLCHVDLVQGIE